MANRRMILASVVCFSIAVLAVRTFSQTRGPNRSEKPAEAAHPGDMTDQERKKELAKMQAERKLEHERRAAESKKKLAERRRKQELEFEQRRKEWEKVKQKEKAEGYMHERWALGTTKEEWKVIKPKLEKVEAIRGRAWSLVGMSLVGSSGGSASSGSNRSPSVPTWQWRRPWKDKAPSDLTEAQKLAKELIALVEKNNTTPQAFKRKMAALRKARSKEAELRRQLSEARRELREVLTTRQEAVLVLMQWL